MPISAKDSFDYAVTRAEHLLTLYDLVHDTRVRQARSDWLTNFKALMRWPQSERLVRIDGKNRDSMLIIRESVQIDASAFSHEYSSELLRASITSSISALDRYVHDLVSGHAVMLLRRPEQEIPKDLAALEIPASTVKKALDKLRNDPNSKPGVILRKQIQEILHRKYTFQKPGDLEKAARLLGIQDLWGKVAKELRPPLAKADIIETLKKLAQRRNQIVHEADLVVQTRSKVIKLRETRRSEAQDALEFVDRLVTAFDKIAASSI